MKPCTKFIIALWVFFLLSLIIHAQRGVTARGGAVSYNNSSVVNNIDSSTTINADVRYGLLDNDTIPQFTIGYLDYIYPGYTYAQKKTIRQANWEAFQAACNWAKANNGRVLLPPAPIEFHINNGEKIEMSNYQTLAIKGAGKGITILNIHPHVKTYTIDVFDLDAKGSNIILDDMTIITEKDRAEYYTCTLRPGGATNQVQITSANVYSWSTVNMVGRTIYTATSTVQTPAQTLTVTNYDAGTKTITVSGTVTSSGDDDAGIIMMYFGEETPVDTIRTYGQYVRNNNNNFNLIYAIEASQPDVTEQNITFNNVSITGPHLITFTSGDNWTIECNNSYFNGLIGTHFMYSNFTTDSYLILNNSIFDENACSIVGYINGDFTAGNLLGSAIYSHPNIQWRFNGCIFKDGNGGATRQYSSGGGKPTPSNAVSFITNCQWINNQEYDVLSSETMPSYYTNCSFQNTVFAHNTIKFSNCLFNGSTIGSYDSNIDILVDACSFTNEGKVSINERNSRLTITNSSFETTSTTKYNIDAYVDYFTMRNCVAKDNGATGIAGYTFFSYSYGPNVTIDNCRFEDTNQYLWWRTNPYTSVSNEYVASQFNPMKITNSYFAYTPFNAYYSNMNNIDMRDNDLTSISANGGVIGAQPNKKPYRKLLSGATINVSPKYNHYFISGAITKIVVPNGVSGTFYFTAVDTVTFTAFADPGNTGSNLNFTGTVLPRETMSMYYDNLNVKSNGTTIITGDVIVSADGISKCFNRTDELTNGSKIEAGSMVVTCGAVTLTDNGDGTLTGTGGSGWIDYYRNNIIVCYDIVPTVGTPVSCDYRHHNTVYQQGMWSKID